MSTLHLGGFQEAADTLSVLSRRGYSRQAVHQLWKRRDINGFPDRKPYRINGYDKLYFDMEDIRHWYQNKDQVVKREEEELETGRPRLLGSILSDSNRLGDPRV